MRPYNYDARVAVVASCPAYCGVERRLTGLGLGLVSWCLKWCVLWIWWTVSLAARGTDSIRFWIYFSARQVVGLEFIGR